MRALQIAKFNQLVADEVGISIRDQQVSLALPHIDARRKRWRPGSGRVDNPARKNHSAITQANAVSFDLPHPSGDFEDSSARLRPLDEKSRSTGRINYAIIRHQQSAAKALPQIGFRISKRLCI